MRSRGSTDQTGITRTTIARLSGGRRTGTDDPLDRAPHVPDTGCQTMKPIIIQCPNIKPCSTKLYSFPIFLNGKESTVSYSSCLQSSSELVPMIQSAVESQNGIRLYRRDDYRIEGWWSFLYNSGITYMRPSLDLGHYARQLYSVRDMARIVRAEGVWKKCECGRRAKLYAFPIKNTVIFKKVFERSWFNKESATTVCSYRCWVRSCLAWRKIEAARLRNEREMKWIRQGKKQLKTFRKLLKQQL